MYEFGGKRVGKEMIKLFNAIHKEQRVPTEWKSTRVNLIHKGGYKNKQELKHYRPISLIKNIHSHPE